MRKLMVIDGNSIINRAFYGIRLLSNSRGVYTNALLGFLNILSRLSEEEKPDGICVCFENGALSSWQTGVVCVRGRRA